MSDLEHYEFQELCKTVLGDDLFSDDTVIVDDELLFIGDDDERLVDIEPSVDDGHPFNIPELPEGC